MKEKRGKAFSRSAKKPDQGKSGKGRHISPTLWRARNMFTRRHSLFFGAKGDLTEGLFHC